MSKVRELVVDDEMAYMLDAYDGNPDMLINRLLADYFTTENVKLKTANGEYEIKNKPEFPLTCNHPEHEVFRYCPYTPEYRLEIGDKPS